MIEDNRALVGERRTMARGPRPPRDQHVRARAFAFRMATRGMSSSYRVGHLRRDRTARGFAAISRRPQSAGYLPRGDSPHRPRRRTAGARNRFVTTAQLEERYRSVPSGFGGKSPGGGVRRCDPTRRAPPRNRPAWNGGRAPEGTRVGRDLREPARRGLAPRR